MSLFSVNSRAACLAALLLTCVASKTVLAIDKIDSPDVTQGELDFEYSGSRTFDRSGGKDNLEDTEGLVAYAPTDRWEIDIGGIFSKAPDQSFQADGILVENFFQFFGKGTHWVDSGIMISCNCSTHDDFTSSVEAKLLLEKDMGQFSHIANIGLEQEIGAHASGGPDRTVQWSSQYNVTDDFAPGFEIQTDFGKPSQGLRWDSGQHYAGPAIYGNVLDHFHYEVAYLAGISGAASDSAVRFLFQYQRHF